MESPSPGGLVDQLAGRIGRRVAAREPMRDWVLSDVERVHLDDGSSVVFKHAAPPFTGEATVLRHLVRHDVPAPEVLAATNDGNTLGMLLEDLGQPLRAATLTDAAAAAVTVHATSPPSGLNVLDAATLADLPKTSLATLAALESAGRFAGSGDIRDGLRTLAKSAADRSRGAELEPYGLCHSEFHPTSVHIGAHGWRLLDWARAFVGPGLLDLASWQGTTEPPELDTLAELIDAYVTAGGAAKAATERGGLPASQWAIGWHRIWVIDWYLDQALTWIAEPVSDSAYQRVIRRHLDEALQCLRP